VVPVTGAPAFAVEAVNLEKTYVLGANAVPALRGVSLRVKPGEFIAVMGPSGCGKTTLLNLVGLLDAPTRGGVFVDGENVSTLSDNARADLRRDKLGFVFQFYNLLPMLTAFENVEIPLNFKGLEGGERATRVEELLTRVDLINRAHHLPAELSGGEQQRVTIARALANRPSIVLLDEPTGDLDSKTGAEIMDLIFQLNREEGTTFIMVTHDPLLASRAGRTLVMQDGKIVEEREQGKAETAAGSAADRKSTSRRPVRTNRAASARAKAAKKPARKGTPLPKKKKKAAPSGRKKAAPSGRKKAVKKTSARKPAKKTSARKSARRKTT
jgi:putative ABC transport system ATP-binding protein